MRINWNDVYVWVIIALSIMAIAGMYVNGLEKTLPTILVAVLTASLLDAFIEKLFYKKLIFPYSGIISGLIVGSIVSFEDPLFIPLIASAVAIISKHILKYKVYHVFNPAAFGLLTSFLLFSKFDSWWAAVPYLMPFLVIIAWKIGKLWIAIPFLLTFVFLGSYTNNLKFQNIADVLSLPYYFAFIMAVEPKTTPISRNQQIAFGISLAVLIVLLSFVVRIPYAILISLLALNFIYFLYRTRR